ncbi:hypothetical protein BGZ83_000164 [Gryganskiella cystojenkinii]|nr:hypothetical protein BGZ83_000164 [Gryganskiella cystojenkinii]
MPTSRPHLPSNQQQQHQNRPSSNTPTTSTTYNSTSTDQGPSSSPAPSHSVTGSTVNTLVENHLHNQHSAVASPHNSPTTSTVDRFTASVDYNVTDTNPCTTTPHSNLPLGLYKNLGDAAVGSLLSTEGQAHKIALVQARLFSQQLMKQQYRLPRSHPRLSHQQQQQPSLLEPHQHPLLAQPRVNISGGLRGVGLGGGLGVGDAGLGDSQRSSAVGSVLNGRPGSIAASSAGGSSPVLGSLPMDERTEQTLLLARPTWVPDQDASACHICAKTFNAMRRKIHGARGLYELIETNNVATLENVLGNGGVDALVYLCNKIHGLELHALATSSLAALAEHQSIQVVLVSKKVMPPLFNLVATYAYQTMTVARLPSPPPMALLRMASTASVHTNSVRRIETVAVVLMNITHIMYQLVYNKPLGKQIVKEGALDSLMSLCVYFPAEVRTRAMERAIRSMALSRNEPNVDNQDTATLSSRGSTGTEMTPQHSQRSTPVEEDENENSMVAMDDTFHVRLENMQGLAAKCIAVLAADISSQALLVDDPEKINRLVQLLYSNNQDVVKYAAKTMAYLSLRNDRFKPNIVKGAGASALLAVIWSGTGVQLEEISSAGGAALSEAISHACCALANLATNTESQEILMAHLDLLNAACSVVGLFSHQREVERHVARLIANLALYEQNKLALLTGDGSPTDHVNPELTPSPGSQSAALPQRFSTPSPSPRRARGNVIPTLLFIGALTLERAHGNNSDGAPHLPQDQETIDFMNDGSNTTVPFDPGHVTPSKSAPSESDHDSTVGGLQDPQDDEVSEWTTIPGMEDIQRHIIRAIDNLMTVVMEDPESSQSFKVFSKIWPTLGLIKTIQMTNQDEDTQRRATHVLTTLIQQQQIHGSTLAAVQQPQQQQSLQEDESAHDSISVAEDERVKHVKPVLVDNASTKAQAEQERLEQERMEKEQASQKRIEDERREQERLETERSELEKQRREQERVEQERLETKRREEERIEQARIDSERREQEERAKQERLEAEQAEKNRLKAESVEKKRAEAERLEQERLETERRLEQQRIEAEQSEKKRIKAERAEKKRLEQERLETERLEQQRIEAEQAEKKRLKTERAEKKRLEQERLEQERIEAEQAEKKRVKAERAEKKRLEQERLEQQRIEAEKAEKKRLVQERIEKERLEKERLEQERLEQERLEQERLEQERLEQEQKERVEEEERKEVERLEQQRIDRDRAEEERKHQEGMEIERLQAEKDEQKHQEKKALEQQNIASKPTKQESAKETHSSSKEPVPAVPEEQDSEEFDLNEASIDTSIKTTHSSEEPSTSQDDEAKPKEKAKKKKKKSAK